MCNPTIPQKTYCQPVVLKAAEYLAKAPLDVKECGVLCQVRCLVDISSFDHDILVRQIDLLEKRLDIVAGKIDLVVEKHAFEIEGMRKQINEKGRLNP